MAESVGDVVITWNDTLEDYLADIAEKSQCLSWLHSKSEVLYSQRQNLVSLPVIVLSSLVGFFSVGSSSMFEGQEKLSSIVLGVVSLLTGVLNTIGSYFSFSKKNENHRVAKISYGKLYRWLSLELSLPRSQRIAAGDLLKMVRQEYERLQETANPIPPEIIITFQHRFKDQKDVSWPNEANGLEKVEVFVEKLGKTTSFRLVSPHPKTPYSPPPPISASTDTIERTDKVSDDASV
jgi:hypothetical protein